jgi:hypothetical protein
MSRSQCNSKMPTPVIPVFAGIVFFGAVLSITPIFAAGTSNAHKNRYSVQNVEQTQDKVSESAVAPEPPDSATNESASTSEAALAREKQAKDKQRMTTHVGDAQPVAFHDFYPFPEPAPAAKASESRSRKSLYWIGAAGVALAAGVAAYFFFSGQDEPERVQTVMAI